MNNNKTFSEAIGISATAEDVDEIPFSEWEKAAKAFLKDESRRMSVREVIDLGKKLYREDVIDMLPSGND